MRIELAWANPDQQQLLTLDLPEHSTIIDALAAANVLQPSPVLSAADLVVGVWGQVEKSPQTRRLQEGDRVEVYRPLLIDPMSARKARADKVRQQRANKAGIDQG